MKGLFAGTFPIVGFETMTGEWGVAAESKEELSNVDLNDLERFTPWSAAFPPFI